MRLRAFLSSYLLFLVVLFIIVTAMSTFMTRSQTNMLREKSLRDYQTISASFSRGISVLYGTSGGFNQNFDMALDNLIRGYSRYYNAYNIELTLTEVDKEILPEISFINDNTGHFIHVTGNIRIVDRIYRFDYFLDITENMTELRSVQNMILLLSLAFSVITAIGLYFILLRIFKPIKIVTNSSKKIADGNYDERIQISGSNELSVMADNFNTMAEEIEVQITGKQQFIDNFTHEIRSPLTSIYGYAEYLQKAPYDEETTLTATQTIMDEANHIKMIATSLLNLATLRDYSPINTEISISALFDDIKNMFGNDVEILCENSIDVIEGQEDLIKSLITNLCTNSMRADAQSITLRAVKAQSGKPIVSIIDNGCGISSDDLLKITEPFYRVDKARSRQQGGAGLGLTLCKKIAEVHGAKLKIESIVNVGTTVSIIWN